MTIIETETEGSEEETRTLGPALDFLKLLWRVDHALQSRSKLLELESGVTGPQRLVLRILGRYPGVSAGEVARLLHLHPSTLTGVLHRLQTRLLIQRRVDPVDGRRALFSLTAKGRKLTEVGTSTIDAAVQRVTERIPVETAATRILLEQLAVELENATG
jgi:DNA-binding MarR family transcriptional regulator